MLVLLICTNKKRKQNVLYRSPYPCKGFYFFVAVILKEVYYAKHSTQITNDFMNGRLLSCNTYLFLVDIDECANEVENDCHTNALCTNIEGSYVCRCKRGYTGDGQDCTGK